MNPSLGLVDYNRLTRDVPVYADGCMSVLLRMHRLSHAASTEPGSLRRLLFVRHSCLSPDADRAPCCGTPTHRKGIRERMKSVPRHSAYCLGGTGVVISLRWNEYHHVRNTFCPTFGPSPVLHRRTCSLERRAPSSDRVPEARQQDSRPQSAAVLPSLPCHYIKDECARQHAMRLCRPGFSIKCP